MGITGGTRQLAVRYLSLVVHGPLYVPGPGPHLLQLPGDLGELLQQVRLVQVLGTAGQPAGGPMVGLCAAIITLLKLMSMWQSSPSPPCPPHMSLATVLM